MFKNIIAVIVMVLTFVSASSCANRKCSTIHAFPREYKHTTSCPVVVQYKPVYKKTVSKQPERFSDDEIFESLKRKHKNKTSSDELKRKPKEPDYIDVDKLLGL